MDLLMLFAASFLAFLVSTVSGGGAGLMLIPLLGVFLPSPVVPAALTVGTAASTGSRLAVFWRSVHWATVRAFVPAAIPGVCLGVFLLRHLNPLWIEFGVALFLLSNLRAALRPKPGEDEPARREPPGSRVAAIGLLAGFLSGLTGAVGLLFNRFYFQYGLRREEVVATRAANEILVHAIKLVLYAATGLLVGRALAAGTAVALGALSATALARPVLRRMPEGLFHRIGYGAMAASGVLMLGATWGTLRRVEDPAARFALVGTEPEVVAQWRSGSLAAEWEWDAGFALESRADFDRLPGSLRREAARIAAGAPIVRTEYVWEVGSRKLEVYVRRNGRVDATEIPLPANEHARRSDLFFLTGLGAGLAVLLLALGHRRRGRTSRLDRTEAVASRPRRVGGA